MSTDHIISKRALSIQCQFDTLLPTNINPDIRTCFVDDEHMMRCVGVEARVTLQLDTYWPDSISEMSLTEQQKENIADTAGAFARAQMRRMLGIVEDAPPQPPRANNMQYKIQMARKLPQYTEPPQHDICARTLARRTNMSAVSDGTSLYSPMHNDDDTYEIHDDDAMRNRAYVTVQSSPETRQILEEAVRNNGGVLALQNEITELERMVIQPSLRPHAPVTVGPEPHHIANSRRIARDNDGTPQS